MDEEWISITDAARRLSEMGDVVDRSTLSRYLKQHVEALPLRPQGKVNLVEFYTLLAHRGENIRLRRPTGPAAASRRAAARPRFEGTQLDGASRKVAADALRAQADAELREMDLALRRRQLTPVAEVDQAGRDAIAMMQNAFERAIETEAQAASLKYGWDERLLRITLKHFARGGLTVFNRLVLERLAEMQRLEADVDASEQDMDLQQVDSEDEQSEA